MMKTTLYGLLCLFAVAAATSCKNVDEEPVMNLGYEKNYQIPDPEPLTAADSAVIAAQKAEYEQNAK